MSHCRNIECHICFEICTLLPSFLLLFDSQILIHWLINSIFSIIFWWQTIISWSNTFSLSWSINTFYDSEIIVKLINIYSSHISFLLFISWMIFAFDLSNLILYKFIVFLFFKLSWDWIILIMFLLMIYDSWEVFFPNLFGFIFSKLQANIWIVRTFLNKLPNFIKLIKI